MNLLKRFDFKPIELVPGDTLTFNINLWDEKGTVLNKSYAHECKKPEVFNRAEVYKGKFRGYKSAFVFVAGDKDDES